MIFYGVGANGAQPGEGLRVQATLQHGSKDLAAKLRFTRLVKRKVLTGTVITVSQDGKSMTLQMVTKKKKGGEVPKMEIHLTGDVHLVFNGIGSGEARPSKGLRARVFFKDGMTDTPEIVILEKTTAK
jgi:hypothetical protein